MISIPQNLPVDMQRLHIQGTNITLLNLTQLAPYPYLISLVTDECPVSTIIPPVPGLTPALKEVFIGKGYFPLPPFLGPLAENLTQYEIVNSLMEAIPDFHFTNYTSLECIDISHNHITQLTERSFHGLGNLQMLDVGRNKFTPLPPLHLWTPNLQHLEVNNLQLTVFPTDVISSLLKLNTLEIHHNPLTTIPAGGFANFTNMESVRLTDVDLHCDQSLCWVKVS